jgi:hypothetical protein
MADYFGFNLDAQGAIRFVFDDTTSQHHGAHLYEIRELKGRTPAGGSVNRPVPSSPMADASGDAQWPHYAPTGPGPNVPQLDLTGVRLTQPDASTLRVRMSLASLASLTPPAGKTGAVWATRFQALSVGDHGEEAYRIFDVGVQSLGGGPPSYFAGTATCTNTDPGNCKVLQYPAQKAVTGVRCANAFVVDVPLQGFGFPIEGTKLFDVMAFAAGRNDDTADVYADVDATPTFDYALGTVTTGPAC